MTLALILVCIILAPMALRALAELSVWFVLFVAVITLALWWF